MNCITFNKAHGPRLAMFFELMRNITYAEKFKLRIFRRCFHYNFSKNEMKLIIGVLLLINSSIAKEGIRSLHENETVAGVGTYPGV